MYDVSHWAMYAERMTRTSRMNASYLNNCRILLAAFDKLVICKFRVLVTIHVLEDLIHSLEMGW